MSGTGDTMPDLLDGLAVDQGIVLLPVRLETRFVTDDTGSKLRVRVYPDDIHIDAHQPGLTDGEVAAAGRYWDAVWRSGRGQPDADAPRRSSNSPTGWESRAPCGSRGRRIPTRRIDPPIRYPKASHWPRHRCSPPCRGSTRRSRGRR